MGAILRRKKMKKRKATKIFHVGHWRQHSYVPLVEKSAKFNLTANHKLVYSNLLLRNEKEQELKLWAIDK